MAELDQAKTHMEKLRVVHHALRARCPGIDRISVALFDRKTGVLKTFIASPFDESPLKNYETGIDNQSSLADVLTTGRPRVVNDLEVFNHGQRQHTQVIAGHGFASSYTFPMVWRGKPAGVLFFNSMHKGYFRSKVLEQVEIFAQLIAEMVLNDLASMQALVAALGTAVNMVHMRDPETGNHLERMARYSRLIARELVRQGHYSLDDEQIEQIFQFAPLHDVGKIAIPDQILQKQGRLDSAEREVMNTHTLIGRKIIDELIGNFGFDQFPYIDYLRNIPEQHHEAMDGSGYPHGLIGNEIALEARIVAVSDIFDALTSARPYKPAWLNDHAFSMMQLMAIDKLDRDCVNALIDRQEDVWSIQSQFGDLAA